MHYGVSATSTNGYNLQLAEGTYKIIAAKPGYIMTPQTLTVSANATLNLVMVSAAYTISGSVTAGGSAARLTPSSGPRRPPADQPSLKPTPAGLTP